MTDTTTNFTLDCDSLISAEAVSPLRRINWTRVGKIAGIATGVAAVAVGAYIVITKVTSGEASVAEAVTAAVEAVAE